MGRKPKQLTQQDILDSAQNSVNKAVEEGKRLAEDLQNRGGQYRDWAKATQNEMQGFLGAGQDPASYYSRIQGQFDPFMQGQQEKFQTQLNKGDYPVLGSPSHQRFEDTLVKSANLYDQYIQRGLDEVQPRFAAIANDPAFNLQLDKRSMDLAKGNINQDQVKRLTTWNV
jgi:hypothetical protein